MATLLNRREIFASKTLPSDREKFASNTLHDHREKLALNPGAYVQDIPRCYHTVVSHLKAAGYRRITLLRAKEDIHSYVNLIFDSQNRRPFFDIGGALPFCWNAPRDWKLDYIHYEWGHLRSRNQNGIEAYCIENLCLQSARCNQHIQSSMNVDDLRYYGGRLLERIDENLQKRTALFQSERWRELSDRLQKWR